MENAGPSAERARRRVHRGLVILTVAIGCAMTGGCGDSQGPGLPVAASQDAPLPRPALLAEETGRRRLFSAAGLEHFFRALARLEARQSQGPVRIIQIGDSHTAGDAFAGRMREILQGHFGAAGRGWLPPGIPFAYYRPRLVRIWQEGWRQLGAGAAGPALPLGLDGAAAESEHPGASMTLISTEAEGFDRLGLEFVAGPGGGDLSIAIDRRPPVLISTAARTLRAKRVTLPAGTAAHQASVTATGARPVILLGWSVERRRAGVIYENHGTIGATIGLLGRLSPATVKRELADGRPALIVVAFGTNEGFDDQLDLPAYERRFRHLVVALARMAPEASVLILGSPDGNRREGTGGEDCCGGTACAWRVPPNLGRVRRIQRRVAAAQGWAFWDWSAAMGGACGIDRLVRHDPPLAFADHVHLNGAGYAASADVLSFDLVRAFRRWRRARGRESGDSMVKE